MLYLLYRVAQKTLDTKRNMLIEVYWLNTDNYSLCKAFKVSSFYTDTLFKSFRKACTCCLTKLPYAGLSVIKHRVSSDFCTTLYSLWNSDNTTSNCRIMIEYCTGRDVEGRGPSLIWVTIPEFVWMDWGKSRNTQDNMGPNRGPKLSLPEYKTVVSVGELWKHERV